MTYAAVKYARYAVPSFRLSKVTCALFESVESEYACAFASWLTTAFFESTPWMIC